MEVLPGQQHADHTRRRGNRSVFSLTLPDGALAETVYDRTERQTRFAIWRHGTVTYERQVEIGSRVFVPYSPHNSLIEHEVILLPATAED